MVTSCRLQVGFTIAHSPFTPYTLYPIPSLELILIQSQLREVHSEVETPFAQNLFNFRK